MYVLTNLLSSLHVGETELGNSFGQAYGKYEEDIVAPFTDFVHLITSKDIPHENI